MKTLRFGGNLILLNLPMDLRDQLKNLFPTHEEQDFELEEEKESK